MDNTISWLLENASPVIKYRTLKELCENINKTTLDSAFQDVLTFSETQKRLERLKNSDIYNTHGGRYEFFDTSLPMVVDFGITKETGLDKYINVDEIIQAYKTNINDEDEVIKMMQKINMYPHFIRAGYRNKEIIDFFTRRIEIIYDFTKNMDWNIYEDKKFYHTKFLNDHRILKAELYTQNHEFRLPLIYDIIGLKELYYFVSDEIKDKISVIIKYIDSPEYNRFDFHYGIIKLDKKYHAVGWDCMLPNYHKDVNTDYSLLLQRLELYSHFPIILKGKWFNDNIELLEKFKTARETYILPKEYLRETNKHWLLGNHMKLGENKKAAPQELESTFWVLKIKKNAGLL
jgi:hypothetical protein